MAALHDVKSSPSMQKARLELWVQIVVAEQDQYTPVSIEDKADCQTGGIFMLRQVSRSLVLCTAHSDSIRIGTYIQFYFKFL